MGLDGKEAIQPTAFDAHEQVVRSQHTHSAAEGYQSAEFTQQEYPKHLGDDDGVAVIAADAKEEEEKTAYLAAKKKDAEASA